MKLIKKFISYSIGGWLGALVGIITIPLVTRYFTPEEFGKASMFTLALTVMMFFVSFGIDQAFIRFFYEENIIKLLKKCLILTSFSYTCGVIIINVFKLQISNYLFGSYDPDIITFLAFAALLYVLNNYAIAILRMKQLSWQYSVAQLSLRVFELIFILLFLYKLGTKYSTIVYARIAAIFLVTIIALILSRRSILETKNAKAANDISKIDLLKFSYPFALTSILTWMLQSVDKMAIRQWSTYKELGIYMAAFRIVAIMDIIGSSFSVYWTPLALERYINKTYDENRLFYKTANAAVSVMMIIVTVVLIMSKDIIVFLLGKSYRDAAQIIPLLVFMPLMYITSETTVIGINFLKKVKWHIVISMSVLVVSIIGNLILVPRIGSRGAAIAIALSYICYFSLRTLLSLKYYKIDYYLKKFYFVVFVLFAYAVYSSFFAWSYLNVICGLAIILLTLQLYANIIKESIKLLTGKG